MNHDLRMKFRDATCRRLNQKISARFLNLVYPKTRILWKKGRFGYGQAFVLRDEPNFNVTKCDYLSFNLTN